jgi:hypothetical protein
LKPDALFQWEREVPAHWQTDLERLTPRMDRVTWLYLQWLPGWPYEPVQRFGVYEIVPLAMIGRILEEQAQSGLKDSPLALQWEHLHGSDPRTLGRFYTDKTTGTERFRGKTLISYPQWCAHRATGGLPLLAWIIQGDWGGHCWQFGPFEQAMFELGGLSVEEVDALMNALPRPGDLPYADYDQRVFRQLATRDRLKQWREARPWDERISRTNAGLLVQTDESAARVAFSKKYLAWIEAQIANVVSDAPRTQVVKFAEDTRHEWEAPGDEDALDHNILTGEPT